MPSNIVLTDLRLATMIATADDPYGLIENATIEIVNGAFTFIGSQENFDGDISQAITMDGRLALPGLVCCHNQVCWAPGDNPAKSQTGSDYLNLTQSVGQATSSADDELLLALMRTRLNKLARSGVTGFELKSGFGLMPDDELRLSLLCRKLQAEIQSFARVTLYVGHFIDEARDPDAYLVDIEKNLVPKTYEKNACDVIEVFCDDDGGLDLDQASTILELYYRNKMPTRVSCDRFADSAGATLPASFYSQAATYLCQSDDMGVESIATVGTVMVLVPDITSRDADSKIPLVEKMRAVNGKIAISTNAGPDGTGELDLISSARLGVERYGLTPVEALQAITIHAATALGVINQIGAVSEGRRGDLAIFDASTPENILLERAHTCSAIVRAGKLSNFFD